MKKLNLGNSKKVKITLTNPLGMQVTVKRRMTDSEIRENLRDGRIYINR